ncbi:hypothetical protein [Streptomyces sp. NPDC051561]|uniref:hypothetical protein n=1 Tax=Streptomyces sp. NPDC051561 TaxID=3365658 RepID=UPI0037A77EBF
MSHIELQQSQPQQSPAPSLTHLVLGVLLALVGLGLCGSLVYVSVSHPRLTDSLSLGVSSLFGLAAVIGVLVLLADRKRQ